VLSQKTRWARVSCVDGADRPDGQSRRGGAEKIFRHFDCLLLYASAAQCSRLLARTASAPRLTDATLERFRACGPCSATSTTAGLRQWLPESEQGRTAISETVWDTDQDRSPILTLDRADIRRCRQPPASSPRYPARPIHPECGFKLPRTRQGFIKVYKKLTGSA
jgi:hypothetical protein